MNVALIINDLYFCCEFSDGTGKSITGEAEIWAYYFLFFYILFFYYLFSSDQMFYLKKEHTIRIKTSLFTLPSLFQVMKKPNSSTLIWQLGSKTNGSCWGTKYIFWILNPERSNPSRAFIWQDVKEAPRAYTAIAPPAETLQSFSKT